MCLIVALITIASHIGSGYCKTFSALLGCRALNGIGFGGLMSLGTPVLNDMFFYHERGKLAQSNQSGTHLTFGRRKDWHLYRVCHKRCTYRRHR